MSINRKIALNSATAAWCCGQYARLRRKGWGSMQRLSLRLGFDAALGFDFMHLCLFGDGIEWW